MNKSHSFFPSTPTPVTQDKFWMIISSDPTTGAKIKHPTKAQAQTEATRLAGLHQDKAFYVMESVEKVEAIKIKRTAL